MSPPDKIPFLEGGGAGEMQIPISSHIYSFMNSIYEPGTVVGTRCKRREQETKYLLLQHVCSSGRSINTNKEIHIKEKDRL
jgi:hypothetical protein